MSVLRDASPSGRMREWRLKKSRIWRGSALVLGRREETSMAQDGDSRSFRTKTGMCTITDDRIVLTRDGARGAAAGAVVGSSITRTLIIYLVLAAVLGFIGVRSVL